MALSGGLAPAETPRVLDVRDFAQARETELRFLLQTIRHEVGESRFGAPFLPRHLRRRATSHRRFVVRRRPNLRLAALYPIDPSSSNRGANGSAGGGGGARSVVTAGLGMETGRRRVRPRVAAGAGASTAVEGGPATGANDGLEPSTSGRGARLAPAVNPQQQRPTNRAMRRRAARLQAALEAACCAADMAPLPPPCSSALPAAPRGASQPPGAQTPEQGMKLGGGQEGAMELEATAEEMEVEAEAEGEDMGNGQQEEEKATERGPRRLETHVWHARRMTMEQRWGHVLAAHAVGRGRGSRSLHAQLRRGALLHDASYVGCVELRGHQRDLAQLLRRVSDPHRLDELLDRPEVISGAAEWSLFLHRPGAFPHAPLAPVRALWLTPPLDEPGAQPPSGEPCASQQPGKAAAAGPAGTGGSSGPDAHVDLQAAPPSTAPAASASSDASPAPLIDEEGWATRCVLWLWVHAAAFGDVWEALQEAADTAAVAAAGVTAVSDPAAAAGAPPRVSIRSRCHDLRRIEVVGAAAGTALARVLQPLACPRPNQSPSPGKPGSGASGGPCSNTPGDSGATRQSHNKAGVSGCGGSTVSEPYGVAAERDLGGSIWRSVWRQAGAGSGAVSTTAAASGGAEGCGNSAERHWQWRWPAGVVVGLVAADPRLASPVAVGAGRADALKVAMDVCRGQGRSGGGDGGNNGQSAAGGSGTASELQQPHVLQHDELRRQFRKWPEAGDWTAGASALWRTCPSSSSSSPATTSSLPGFDGSSHEAGAVPKSGLALGASSLSSSAQDSSLFPPPMSQSAVGAVRRAARQQLLLAGLAMKPQIPQDPQARDGDGSSAPGSGSGVSCPVLLVKRPGGMLPSSCGGAAAAVAARKGNGSDEAGWSLILPARWVMPVWLALTFTGARPTGQAEWRQIMTSTSTPCFPYDHPFTHAGERYTRERLAELAAAASKRPMGRARILDTGPTADWTRLGQLLDLSSMRQPPDALRGCPQQRRCRGRVQQPGIDTVEAGAGASVGPIHRISGGTCAAGTLHRQTVSEPAESLSGGPEATCMEGRPTATHGQRSVAPPATAWALALSESLLHGVMGGTAEPRPEPQGASRAQLPHGGRGNKETAGRKDKSILQGWSLRKALKLGLLTPSSVPAALPILTQTSSTAAVAAPPPLLSHATPSNQASSAVCTVGSSVQRRCLVYVALRVVGRGVCGPGAEVVGLYRGEGDMPFHGGNMSDPSRQSVLTSIATPPVHQEQLQQQHGQKAVLLGYVVSAATRGPALYPGGIAVCDASCLPPLRPAQQGGQRHGTDAGAELASSVLFGGYGADGGSDCKTAGRVPGTQATLHVWVRNMGSVALRLCRANMLLEPRFNY